MIAVYIYLLIILLLTILVIILFINSSNLKGKFVDLEKNSNENHQVNTQMLTDLISKYESLLKKIPAIEREAYEKGVSEMRNRLTVHIDPIQNETGINWFVYNSKTLEIGYQYSLWYDNLPLKFEAKQITYSIKTSEINQENLQIILGQIESIQNLASGAFIVNGSLQFAKQKLIEKFGKK